jgi:hypothetical protein
MELLELETLFISGVPKNKVELLEGKTHCAAAFPTREEAERTFEHWLQTLARWKGAPAETERGPDAWNGRCAGCELELSGRRLDAHIPLRGGAHFEFYHNFWDPLLWDAPRPGPSGHMALQDLWMGLHGLLHPLERHGYQVSGKVDLVLSDRSVVAPQSYVFRPGAWSWFGGPGDFFAGVPHLVVELLFPATRAEDLPETGRRAAVFASAGVPHYWLLDPVERQLLDHELDGGRYRLARVLRPGDPFRPAYLPELLGLDPLFERETDFDVGPALVVGKIDEDDPAWQVPDEPLTLEHLLLLGHPQRRFEVLDDVAPCAVAFRDARKARSNFEDWARQAARREGLAEPRAAGTSFDVGRFHLALRGRRVYLDLAYPARLHRRMLEAYSQPELWR